MAVRTRLSLSVFAGLLLGAMATAGCATAGPISDAKVQSGVEKTVAERQPTAEDKRFDEIGWVTDIRTAMRLGRENNRPIFLYTGDGHVNTGRC